MRIPLVRVSLSQLPIVMRPNESRLMAVLSLLVLPAPDVCNCDSIYCRSVALSIGKVSNHLITFVIYVMSLEIILYLSIKITFCLFYE